MVTIVTLVSLVFVINYLANDYFTGIRGRTHVERFSFRNYRSIRIREITETEKHDKWIVITSINYPTEDVKKLAAIPGWKMVMVGDTKSPKDWK